MTLRLKRVLEFAGLWTGIALFFVAQRAVQLTLRGADFGWYNVVGREFLYWTPFLFLTPMLLFMARQFRLEPDHRWRNIGVHLLAALAFSIVQVTLYEGLQYAAIGIVAANPAEQQARLITGMKVGFPVLTLTAFYKYWVFVGIYYAVDYYKRYREQEVAASQLQAQLAKSQLQALKMQLHPHFLFNTLHSVSMLNLTDVDAANRVLVKLSDLLRITLSNTGAQEVTLKTEIDFLQLYLEIEGLRFQDRMRFQFDVSGDVLDALVPSLLLQPLVENAVRHGIGAVSTAGQITVRGRASGSSLILEVSDDGPGLPPEFDLDRDAGVGLANVSERLQHPGLDGRLEFPQTASGTTVRVIVPLRFAEGEPDERASDQQ